MIEVVPDYSAYTGSRGTAPSPSPRHVLRNIIIAIVTVILIAVGTVFGIGVMQRSQTVEAVKNTLVAQNKTMQASVKEGVYSATVPAQVKSTEDVSITASVSADGKSYCISGRSIDDEKIVYNIGSHTDVDAPKEGDCESKENAVIPAKPSVPSIGSATAEGVTLTWAPTIFAASYNLRCAIDKDFSASVVKAVSKTNTGTVKGLKANTPYFCSIQAVNETGVSLWSDSVNARTILLSTAPADLKITPVSSSEIKVEWGAVSGVISYELEYSSDANFAKDVKKQLLSVTSTTVGGLKADTQYYFHVRAFTEQFSESNAAFSGVVEDKTLK